jgi:predicted RNase H-like nuclease (RuvC/YqgF family)
MEESSMKEQIIKALTEALKDKLVEGQNIEEIASSITESIKKDVSKDFMPKSDFKAKEDELNSLQTKYDADIKSRDTQLETLKGLEGKEEEWKKKLADFETQNNTAKADYDQKIQEIENKRISDKKIFSLTDAFRSEGIKDQYMEMALKSVDSSVLSYGEDGKLIGQNDVVSGFKTKFGDMFGETVHKGPGDPTPNPNPNPAPPTDESKMSDTEWIKNRDKQNK